MELTRKHVDLFIRYTKLPIPVNDQKHFEYYIDLFDEYYDSKRQYKIFKDCYTKYNDIESYKTTIREKTDKIIKMFKPEGEKYNLLREYMDMDIEKVYGKVKNNILLEKSTKKGVYIEENSNSDKLFMSIDLKSANFLTVVKHNKDIFDGFSNWYDFMISQGCDEFVASSKHFREVFFGEIKVCKKARGIYKYYLDDVYEFIKEKYNYKDDEIVCVSEDEIVLQYKYGYPSVIKQAFSNMLNVEIFKLTRHGNHPYYIKEIININERDIKKIDSTKKVLKCVPKKFICQYIKFIKNKILHENDLKFTDEHLTARYLYPYFIDKDSNLNIPNDENVFCHKKIMCLIYGIIFGYFITVIAFGHFMDH